MVVCRILPWPCCMPTRTICKSPISRWEGDHEIFILAVHLSSTVYHHACSWLAQFINGRGQQSEWDWCRVFPILSHFSFPPAARDSPLFMLLKGVSPVRGGIPKVDAYAKFRRVPFFCFLFSLSSLHCFFSVSFLSFKFTAILLPRYRNNQGWQKGKRTKYESSASGCLIFSSQQLGSLISPYQQCYVPLSNGFLLVSQFPW
jgi:hypothetical protein